MGNINIYGVNYADIVSTTAIDDEGIVYLIQPIGNDPSESAPMYEEQHVTYPGVGGMGVKRFGFRGRIIVAEMGFLGTNKTMCESDKNTFEATLVGLASFPITIPGGTTRQYCRLQSSQPIGYQQYGLDQMLLKVRYEFLQVREN